MHYVHKKVKLGPKVATFRTKTLNFTPVLHLNWLAKIELRGPVPIFVNIVGHYCCTRVLLHAKKLKETETEETVGFFVTFLSLVAFLMQ